MGNAAIHQDPPVPAGAGRQAEALAESLAASAGLSSVAHDHSPVSNSRSRPPPEILLQGQRLRAQMRAKQAQARQHPTDVQHFRPSDSRKARLWLAPGAQDADVQAAGEPTEEEQERLRRAAHRRWLFGESGPVPQSPGLGSSMGSPSAASPTAPASSSRSMPVKTPASELQHDPRAQVHRALIDNTRRYVEHKRYRTKLKRWESLPWLMRQFVHGPNAQRTSDGATQAARGDDPAVRCPPVSPAPTCPHASTFIVYTT